MTRPKLVIFDCDGVLVETESITSRLLSDDLATYGLHIPPHEIHDLFAGGTMLSARQDAISRGAALPDDWVDIINAAVIVELAKGVHVFDGLFDLLDALDANGIATAIASNGPVAKMQTSLGPSGLWRRFEGRVFSGRDFGAPKPAPGMLLGAAKQAGVDPSDAIMIDDTTAGTRAADAAGMRAIGFAAASDAGALAATGHPVAHTMGQVQTLLLG